MSLEQLLRTDLHDAVEQVPNRHGALDAVISTGARRRTIARYSQGAATLLIIAIVAAGSIALRGAPGDHTAAGEDAVSTIRIGGFEVAVNGLAPGFEEQEVYRAGTNPTPAFPTDQYGTEQPVEFTAPKPADVEAIGAPAIYLGDFPLTGNSGFLYTDSNGLACLRLGTVWCIDTTEQQAGALQWEIRPTSPDPGGGATMVVAWYGLPRQTSIVTATVDAQPVGWQHVTGGTAILRVPIDNGSDLTLTGLDKAGNQINFGHDDTGKLIPGQQHFNNITLEGIDK